MSRLAALWLLCIVGVIFALGILDAFIDPRHRLLPEQFVQISAVILSGVAIGSILAALRRNGGVGPDDPAHPEARPGQAARIETMQDENPADPGEID